jgi:FkbH-like protein
MIPFDLYWLPEHASFNDALRSAGKSRGSFDAVLAAFRDLAASRLDFIKTGKLDRVFQSVISDYPDADIGVRRLKVGILSSCTVDHLVPAIRVGALRRGLVADCYVAPYGQYHQEVIDPASGLRRFAPDVVLMQIDSQSVLSECSLTAGAQEVDDAVSGRVAEIAQLWEAIQRDLGAVVIQQAVLDRSQPLFGNFEVRVPASPTRIIQHFNWLLGNRAGAANALWLDMDWWARRIGTKNLSDPRLWHQAKQEISPIQAPLFGDLVARQLAAIRGLSKKCLVLDLDNTIWGGVIGDDGLDGIALGQGDPLGEAFAAFQGYAKRLSERGVILAVASKNDPDIAKSAFERHPEMILQLGDIAAFEATWFDKPASLQRIAKEQNIGLDSLVFFDDNPMERALMRETLPQVAVPEVPEAAENYIACLVDAGYFETVAFTKEDLKRTQQYVANRQRNEIQAKAADLDSFLRDLQMEMQVGAFDTPNLPRIVQLINKTNQFNLTTRRYTEAEALALISDNNSVTYHVRLKDRFGDNGIISIVIARFDSADGEVVLDVDTWLMSCRVLGRRVEEAILNLLVESANKEGATAIRGRYIPTDRNELVRDHYAKLGFERIETGTANGSGPTEWTLPVAGYEPRFTNLFEMVRTDGPS